MANHRYGRIKLALAGFTAAAVLAGASFLQPSGSSTTNAADAVTISYQSTTAAATGAATTAATSSAATTAAATTKTTTTTTATTAKASRGS